MRKLSCHFCSGHKDKTRDKASTGACVLSSFPCVRIYVVYSIGSTEYEALLHPDSIQAAGLYREVCSNQPLGLFRPRFYDKTRLGQS